MAIDGPRELVAGGEGPEGRRTRRERTRGRVTWSLEHGHASKVTSRRLSILSPGRSLAGIPPCPSKLRSGMLPHDRHPVLVQIWRNESTSSPTAESSKVLASDTLPGGGLRSTASPGGVETPPITRSLSQVRSGSPSVDVRSRLKARRKATMMP